MNQLPPMSFSSIQTFYKCKRAFHYRYIEKDKTRLPAPAAERGTRIHTFVEEYIKGLNPTLPQELPLQNYIDFQPFLEPLKEGYQQGTVLTEEEWGYTPTWQPCEYDDPEAMIRGKCDIVNLNPLTPTVIDIKTGKRKGNELKHNEQIALYCLFTFIRYPHIQTLLGDLYYLDLDTIVSITSEFRNIHKIKTLYETKIEEIKQETQFLPKPNIWSCKYCDYQNICTASAFSTQQEPQEDFISSLKRKSITPP